MDGFVYTVTTTTVLLLLQVLIADRFANAGTRRFTLLTGAHALVSFAALIAFAVTRQDAELLAGTTVLGQVGVLANGVSLLMLALVGFVGWIVCRFSCRYLDGESQQNRFLRWAGFTVGAVSLLVLANNFALMIAAWMASSFGLHRLLTHYSDRPAAMRAAWTKFAFSRVGDLFLVLSALMAFRHFGTLEITAFSESVTSDAPSAPLWIGLCLAIGVMIKTVQFPFHTWLPDTMDAPTSVSALMHAGVVNAGGYVLIRLSPLVTGSAVAMLVLVVIGALTTFGAALVMTTQHSIKRKLAWSTIAQMGLMILQCGLGAFSAAMLHLVAHSMYKAYSFLNSGSVVVQASAVRGATQRKLSDGEVEGFSLFSATVVGLLVFAAAALLIGFDISAKPGGLLLGAIFAIGMSRFIWNLSKANTKGLAEIGLIAVFALSLSYLGAYAGIDALVSPSLAASTPIQSWPVQVAVLLALGVCLLVEHCVLTKRVPGLLHSLRVHASNGFYIDAWQRNLSR
ncbi:MAG: proton-conducting transporter membrane subunit [Planctomycetaceae bacterium]